MGVQHLSPWTTREAPPSLFLIFPVFSPCVLERWGLTVGHHCAWVLTFLLGFCYTHYRFPKVPASASAACACTGILCPLAFCLSILLPFSSKECDYFSLGSGLSQSLCTIQGIISLRLFIILKADFPDRTYTHRHKPKENKTDVLFLCAN